MPSETLLSEVLKEFAQTVLTDVPSQAILDRLVERIVGVLPITSAGVTLIEAGASPEYVAASDPAALRYERLQTDLREGPCLTAYESGEAVEVPDLRLERRFPTFCSHTLAAGLAAVFTFPLHTGDDHFGALDLYRETPGPLSAAARSEARNLADVASAYLANARTRHDLQELGKAQSDLVSKISHELRSPLNGIIGYAELLIDETPGPLNEQQQQMLNIVERYSRHLLDLIEGLLTTSRFEPEDHALNLATFHVRDMVERTRRTSGVLNIASTGAAGSDLVG